MIENIRRGKKDEEGKKRRKKKTGGMGEGKIINNCF